MLLTRLTRVQAFLTAMDLLRRPAKRRRKRQVFSRIAEDLENRTLLSTVGQSVDVGEVWTPPSPAEVQHLEQQKTDSRPVADVHRQTPVSSEAKKRARPTGSRESFITQNREERRNGGTYQATGEKRPPATVEQIVQNERNLRGSMDARNGDSRENQVESAPIGRHTARNAAESAPVIDAAFGDERFVDALFDRDPQRTSPTIDEMPTKLVESQTLVSRNDAVRDSKHHEAPSAGNDGGVLDYLARSGKQVLLGNYTDQTTALGTAAQIGLGLTGLDFAADARDLFHDVTHWQWTREHVGRTMLDGVGFLPVIGALKHVDEAAALRKLDSGAVDPVIHAQQQATKQLIYANSPTQLTEHLRPTLDRIRAGERLPYQNDKTIFENRILKGKSTPELPDKPYGEYIEYVHPTRSKRPGIERVVVGGNELYYTPDHYEHFIPLNPNAR